MRLVFLFLVLLCAELIIAALQLGELMPSANM